MSAACGLGGSLLRRPNIYLWQLFSLTSLCGKPSSSRTIVTTTATPSPRRPQRLPTPAALFVTKKTRPCRTPLHPLPSPLGHICKRHLSFNMFDLLPDLERLKTKRSKKIEEAVGKGNVGKSFLSDLEHHTRPLKGFERMHRPHNDPAKGAQTRPLKQEVYRFQRSATATTDEQPSPPPGSAKRPEDTAGARIEQLQQIPDLTLRCTELDIAGNVTVRAGEFQKSELCAQHGLQPRDLRKIDSKFVNQMPAILVRKHAIL
ncbi:magnesium ion transporter, partial [Coemansia sp. RSA 2703]